MSKAKNMTGYPSIDKPWLKYYTEEAITSAIPEASIYEYLLSCNKDYTDDIAIMYFGKTISYQQLFQMIEGAANSFRLLDVKQGDIVSVLSLCTPETIASVYALNKIGAIVSMEPITQTNQLLEQSLQETNTKIILVLDIFYEAYAQTLNNVLLKKVIILRTNIQSMPSFNLSVDKYLTFEAFIGLSENQQIANSTYHFSENEPAVIVQTSGTTAIAKKVVLTNKNINSVVWQYNIANLDFIRGETFLEIVPPHLAVGFTLQMHTPLCLGLRSIIGLDADPQKVVAMFAAYNPNNFMAGVAHVKAIAASPLTQNMDLSNLKNFAIGGESISPEERNQINHYLTEHGAKIKLITGYGMTELSSSVITEQKGIENINSIGIPLSHASAKIVDIETQKELTYCKTGEILISSPSMMLEYRNNKNETDKVIDVDSDGVRWLHTGDVGYIDQEGYIYVVGRLKRIYQVFDFESNMIFKMYPDYIEGEIDNCPIVNRAAIVVVEDSKLINKAIAFIELKKDCKNPVETIKEHIAERLEPYNRPVGYVIIEKMPLLSSGKINYRVLEEKLK